MLKTQAININMVTIKIIQFFPSNIVLYTRTFHVSSQVFDTPINREVMQRFDLHMKSTADSVVMEG